MKTSQWFLETKLDKRPDAQCGLDVHCSDCKPNGDCDSCDSIDGRNMECVNEYASTCDGGCMELTHHYHLTMDPITQLGYCDDCIPKQPKKVLNRLKAVVAGTYTGPGIF